MVTLLPQSRSMKRSGPLSSWPKYAMTDGPSPVMADRLGGRAPRPHLYLWTMPAPSPDAETLRSYAFARHSREGGLRTAEPNIQRLPVNRVHGSPPSRG